MVICGFDWAKLAYVKRSFTFEKLDVHELNFEKLSMSTSTDGSAATDNLATTDSTIRCGTSPSALFSHLNFAPNVIIARLYSCVQIHAWVSHGKGVWLTELGQ